MTITVEDGSIVAGANSYVDVTDCGTFLTSRGNTVWADEDVTLQEAALLRAADYLEQKYKLRWKGYKVSADHPFLSFPRYGVYDEDGYSYSETEIPQLLIDAQCLLAGRALVDGELVALTTDVVQDDLTKVRQVKVDVLEKETEYFHALPNSFYVEVANLLSPLIISSGYAIVRG